MRSTPGPAKPGACPRGQRLIKQPTAFVANIRLGWKDLQITNGLAYSAFSLMTERPKSIHAWQAVSCLSCLSYDNYGQNLT